MLDENTFIRTIKVICFIGGIIYAAYNIFDVVAVLVGFIIWCEIEEVKIELKRLSRISNKGKKE